MAIVILGANGQLGQAFLRALGSKAVGLARAQFDLLQPTSFRSILESLHPETVINCAAYNGVDKAESEPASAFAVNALNLRVLAEVCDLLQCELVHFSTNYVFGLNELRRTPYVESDPPGPVSTYGVSKLAGEYPVRSIARRHLVLRTCGLFGLSQQVTSRGNFVEAMLDRAKRREPLRVVDDQICSPTRTDDLVQATLHLLHAQAYGLYHLTSAGECTWHEFARTVFALTGITADVRAIKSTEFDALAKRPGYSTLANSAYARLGLPLIQHWRDALASYLNDPGAKDNVPW